MAVLGRRSRVAPGLLKLCGGGVGCVAGLCRGVHASCHRSAVWSRGLLCPGGFFSVIVVGSVVPIRIGSTECCDAAFHVVFDGVIACDDRESE